MMHWHSVCVRKCLCASSDCTYKHTCTLHFHNIHRISYIVSSATPSSQTSQAHDTLDQLCLSFSHPSFRGAPYPYHHHRVATRSADWFNKIRKNISDTQVYRAMHWWLVRSSSNTHTHTLAQLLVRRTSAQYKTLLCSPVNSRRKLKKFRWQNSILTIFPLIILLMCGQRQLNYYLPFHFIHSIFTRHRAPPPPAT